MKHLLQLLILVSFPLVLVGNVQQPEQSIPFNFRSDLFSILDFDAEMTNGSGGYVLNIVALDAGGNTHYKIEGAYTFVFDRSDTVSLEFFRGIATHPIGSFKETILIKYLVEDGVKTHDKAVATDQTALFHFDERGKHIRNNRIPLWLSILPPLVAIMFALIFKEVIASLFLSIFMGAFILTNFNPLRIPESIFTALDKYIVQALVNSSHISVVIFSLLIGGMVGVISRNGGMAGVVQKLSKYANSARNSQFVTWLLGIAIFFDDYANTLIVGNTIRPVTDKFRVSREKLAYIVDSTAAPVSAIAFVTTWIGAELGYIGTQTKALGIDESAYSIFLHSLEFAYYPFFTLLFILMIIFMKRDFGPMLKAENRSRITGVVYDKTKTPLGDVEVDDSFRELDPVKGIRFRWTNAFFPILTVLVVTITGLIVTGYDAEVWQSGSTFFQQISNVIGNADSYTALLWGSLSGVSVAIFLSVITKTLKFRFAIESMMDGFKTILPAVLILTLAWSLAAVTEELHTADFLTGAFNGIIAPGMMPVITFILAALISFSTGSSWSTMAILYPIALPMTWALGVNEGMEYQQIMMIMYNVTAVVLGGSVFGDHCSPISDTTVMSSLATSCNHIDHVRTQLPYAITVGTVSVLAGGFLVFAGIPWWLNYPIGIALLIACVRWLGKKVAKPDESFAKMDSQPQG